MLHDFTKSHYDGNTVDSCYSYKALGKPYVRIEVDVCFWFYCFVDKLIPVLVKG